MVQITTSRNLGFSWHQSLRYAVKGYANCDGIMRRGEALCSYFTRAQSIEEFAALLRAANGCFAVIGQLGRDTVAAVDTVRSIPLFYSSEQKYISDDIYFGFGEGKHELDPTALDAFLQSGYTIGPSTFFKGINQLQAGQFLTANSIQIRAQYYYRHYHSCIERSFSSPPFDEILDISDQVFSRLVESCQGRQIVVPLSGGYDSRYIVAMLKRLDYHNVLCFSYGRRDSFEAQTSNAVAKKLGFPWKFVEYDKKIWRDVLADWKYFAYASNGCSLPHIQGIPALKALKAEGAFADDAVFVPGYCGDLLGGSYVPREIIQGDSGRLLQNPLSHYLRTRDFSLRADNAGYRTIEDQVAREVINNRTENERSYINFNEEFFTRHKVARFVVNDVRSFEYIGHEWRLPLWDTELTNFWYSVNSALRYKNELYNSFLMTTIFEKYGIQNRKGGVASIKHKFVRGPFTNRIYERVKPLLRKLAGPILGTGVTDFNAFGELEEIIAGDMDSAPCASPQNINANLAIWFMEKIINSGRWKEGSPES
jgi:asparagine synthase (glutamine-hydrolysing)